MEHFVYITTNLINGKQYVGDHSTNNLNDNYLGSGRPYFKNALKEYGKENFKREILEFFPTKQEAYEAQEKYIKLYKTHVSENGYNLSFKGGNNCPGGISEEGRKRISEANKGRIFSEESRKKMSVAKKGTKLSEDHKRKIREAENNKNVSLETRKKLSIALEGKNKGKIPWNKGIACSEESKRKQIETKRKKLTN